MFSATQRMFNCRFLFFFYSKRYEFIARSFGDLYSVFLCIFSWMINHCQKNSQNCKLQSQILFFETLKNFFTLEYKTRSDTLLRWANPNRSFLQSRYFILFVFEIHLIKVPKQIMLCSMKWEQRAGKIWLIKYKISCSTYAWTIKSPIKYINFFYYVLSVKFLTRIFWRKEQYKVKLLFVVQLLIKFHH